MLKNIIAAGALAVAVTGCAAAGNGASSHAAVGSSAPSWSEPTISGETMTMASLAGKPVWLSFFATWCPPCNDEAPTVNALALHYKSAGLQVVGIDVLESIGKAKQFANQHHLSYPAVVDSGTLRDAYDINGMPVNVFIDKTGVVRAIRVGEQTRDQMEADVKKIL